MTGSQPMTPQQAQILADALDLEHGGNLVAVFNGLMTRVHSIETCERRGGACWIHRPTQDWPLAGRPVYYRAATHMAYRSCIHDVLHPDIDSVAWASRGITKYAGREIGPDDPAWHPACDGCCIPEEYR